MDVLKADPFVETRPLHRNLDALTGLRFVAAAMIVWCHSAGNFGFQIAPAFLVQGVSFFFVLSGFILAYRYPVLESWQATRRFMIARVARIWPLHIVTLALAVFALGLPLVPALGVNALLLQTWYPAPALFMVGNVPSWSVSVELFFYLSFPLLIWRWKSTYLYKLAGSALLVAMTLYLAMYIKVEKLEGDVNVESLLYVWPLARVLEFTLGIASCSAWRWIMGHHMDRRLGRHAWTAIEIGSVIAVLVLLDFKPDVGVLAKWLEGTSAAPGFCLVTIVFATQRGLLSNALATKPAVFFGEISYAVYLVHSTALIWYTKSALGRPAPDYVALVLFISWTTVFSWALWRLVEIPCRDGIRGLGSGRPVLGAFSFRAAALPFCGLVAALLMWAGLSIYFPLSGLAEVKIAEGRPDIIRGTCSFDSVHLAVGSKNSRVRRVRLGGWMLDMPTQSAPPDVRFLFVNDENTAYQVVAERFETPTIAINLSNAAYQRAGAFALINAKDIPAGLYTVYLEQLVGERWMACRADNKLLSSNGELVVERLVAKP